MKELEKEGKKYNYIYKKTARHGACSELGGRLFKKQSRKYYSFIRDHPLRVPKLLKINEQHIKSGKNNNGHG